jgi:hypothetical protein
MTSRLQQADTSHRLTSQSRSIKEVKDEEERAAQKRSAYFEEQEKRRLKGLANASARRAARENQVMAFAIVAFIILGLLIVAALFYNFVLR